MKDDIRFGKPDRCGPDTMLSFLINPVKKTTPEKILALLPRTQCQKCGYESCRDYASAMAKGAPINRCPTGGAKGIRRLSRLTGKAWTPLDPKHGEEGPRAIAVIDDSTCVGCRLCITACPVDAIIGAQGFNHTVFPLQCTGCGLCLPACPVDSIVMKNVSAGKTGWDAWSETQAKRAKTQHALRQARRAREEQNEQKRLKSLAKTGSAAGKKKSVVQAAIEKARAQSAKTA